MRPNFTITTDSFDTIYERAMELVQLLNVANVHLPPAGRHQRYIHQISRMRTNRPAGQRQKRFSLSEAHRGILELGELGFIARELSRAPEVAGWRVLMREALSGASHPSHERVHNRARDVQFEMYIASILRGAGYDVAFQEPDIIVPTSWGEIAVAAKRPRSVSNLAKIFKDADHQIERTGKQGIIAVDISFLSNPTDMSVHTSDAKRGIETARAITDLFVDRNSELIRSLLKVTHTFGYIIHATTLVFDSVTPQLASGRGLVFSNVCGLDDPRMEILEEFRKRTTCAMPSA